MATIYEIAKEAKVSPGTVSRILNGKVKESWPTMVERARKVRAIAKRLGYRPNTFARGISTGRFGAVALVLSTDRGRSYLPAALLDGIHDALAERDMHLTITRLPDEKLINEGYLPKILRQTMTDGLLLDYTHDIPGTMIDLIARYRLASVWLNTKRDADSVYPDDFAASRRLTAEMIALGHRDIAFVRFSHDLPKSSIDHYSVVDRRGGYEAAMREAGLTARMKSPPLRWVQEERLASARAVLSGANRPSAIITYGGHELAAMGLAASAMGLRVPDDLSLATFSDQDYDLGGQPVTRMQVSRYDMGVRAVEVLLAKIEDVGTRIPSSAIPYEFKPGCTAGPGPGAGRYQSTDGRT